MRSVEKQARLLSSLSSFQPATVMIPQEKIMYEVLRTLCGNGVIFAYELVGMIETFSLNLTRRRALRYSGDGY